MKNIFLLSVAIITLSGCSLLKNNSYHELKTVNQFELNQPVTLSAGSSYAYILDGEVVKRDKIDTFDVYCKLAVPRSKDSGELTIEPGVFQISNSYERYYSYQPNIDNDGLEVASLQLASFSGGGNGGSSRRDLTLYFELAPSNQSLIKSISCIRFADPRPHNFLTLDDAQNVFRDLGSFQRKNK